MVVAVAYAVFRSETGGLIPGPSTTPRTGAASNWLGPVGFAVKVTSVQRTGSSLVVQLSFRNTSNSQQRADPGDFTLVSGHQNLRPTFGPGCPNWGRVDLYPSGATSQALRDPGGTRAGSTWGPSSLCFPVSRLPAKLILEWSPDVAFGPLSDTTRIDLGKH